MAVVRPLQIMLFVIATSLAAICPPGWYRYGESCYYIITSPLNWTDAKTACADLQGRLAVPRSEMEQSFIWNTYVNISHGTPPHSLWIDCNDREEEGNWQQCPLVDESAGYQNWKDGEPNDYGNGEDCAIIHRDLVGKWEDRHCSGTYYAVCQQPAATSSTPAYCLHASPDGRISSRCLVGHVVKELPADGVVSCGKACRLEPRCRSFNLLDQGGRDEKITCQLNNGTSDAANEGELIEIENCYLFDI